MERDPDVFIIGEDVGKRGGVFLASQGLIDRFGEERVIDAPLAEASIVGIALGASYKGLRPIAEIQFSDFIWPAANQLIGEAARVHYGTDGAVNAPMVVRVPLRGRYPWRSLPFSERRVLLFPHTRPEGHRSLLPPTTSRGCSSPPSGTTTRWCSLSTRRRIRLVRGEVPDVRLHPSNRKGRREAGGQSHQRHQLRPDASLLPGSCGTR